MQFRSSQKLVFRQNYIFRWIFFALVLLLISQFILPRTIVTTGAQTSLGTINTEISTIAGGGFSSNVKAVEASVSLPSAVAVDLLKRGAFVIDTFSRNPRVHLSSAIRKVNAAGIISTFSAGLNVPTAITTATNGQAYVVAGNNSDCNYDFPGLVNCGDGSGRRHAGGFVCQAMGNTGQWVAFDNLHLVRVVQ